MLLYLTATIVISPLNHSQAYSFSLECNMAFIQQPNKLFFLMKRLEVQPFVVVRAKKKSVPLFE